VSKSVFTEKYVKFRRLLVEVRQAHQLTQVQVAERLQKPQSFVSKYERGERRLDVVEFLEVARALGVDPSDFLEQLEYSGAEMAADRDR
jgi:transcriptional regulator with XRE-family HTH domain